MIENAEDFLAHFAAIAGNYKWQMLGRHLCAFKANTFYDPLMALAEIATGDYVSRHNLEDVVPKLRLTNRAYTDIFNALYTHTSEDPRILQLRRELKKICGIDHLSTDECKGQPFMSSTTL